MILYRPVGLQEMELIYDSGMKAFPARQPQQPIFYPVLDLAYARQTASGWNAKNGQLAGYVTEFKVEDEYIDKFEQHAVGGSQHQEYWIPAEQMDEFNRHITGHIKVVEAHFAEAFQGFIPDQFGLQGKNAVEQFTLLTNSYLYKRMDFYLEIKRNHKAVFLNYPFWHKHEFKNPALKEKVLQAIKEAWLTSFPKVPLPVPFLEEAGSQEDSDPFVDEEDEEDTPDEPIILHSRVDPVEEQDRPEEEKKSTQPVKPVPEKIQPVSNKEARPPQNPVRKEIPPEKKIPPQAPATPPHRENRPPINTPFHGVAKPAPVQSPPRPVKQAESHFVQGVKLGLSEKYDEAVEELSRAVKEDPAHVVAQTSLGVAYRRLGQDDRALSCYDAALRKDPKYG
ncbi:MAG: tetratricopeptide repeat protein, partial [Syntrophothermus sp.]